MRTSFILPLAAAAAALGRAVNCPAYDSYAAQKEHPLFSTGRYGYPMQRPRPECRTYAVPEIENTIIRVESQIEDKDLYRLFLNTWPNTLDTTIAWHGVSRDDANEELAFIITGDINAMWLRDSTNQLQSYKPILTAPANSNDNTTAGNSSSIATLFRGAINLQARYIRQFPFCNAFQPPPESQLSASRGGNPVVQPPYDPTIVFECKFELDSLAAFLQLSWDYYEATGDAAFFRRFYWPDAVRRILGVARDMMNGTYAADGQVLPSPYTWINSANSATETVSKKGTGNPVVGDLGLVRSFFRPSDDSTIYQYFIPGNMMFSRFLNACTVIMQPIDGNGATQMAKMADGIAHAIEKHAVLPHPVFGSIYAFEVDGFVSANFMDDANVPSLLSIPHLGFKFASDPVYQRTRGFVLSRSNPYFNSGPVLNATGGPHLGPGMAWPMGVIMQILTSDFDDEIVHGIKQLMGSTSGLGLIHESVNTHHESSWTRSWFAWANGLFGQMILDLLERKPALLRRSYQN